MIALLPHGMGTKWRPHLSEMGTKWGPSATEGFRDQFLLTSNQMVALTFDTFLGPKWGPKN